MPDYLAAIDLRNLAYLLDDESDREWTSESALEERRLEILYGDLPITLHWDGGEYNLVLPD